MTGRAMSRRARVQGQSFVADRPSAVRSRRPSLLVDLAGLEGQPPVITIPFAVKRFNNG